MHCEQCFTGKYLKKKSPSLLAVISFVVFSVTENMYATKKNSISSVMLQLMLLPLPHNTLSRLVRDLCISLVCLIHLFFFLSLCSLIVRKWVGCGRCEMFDIKKPICTYSHTFSCTCVHVCVCVCVCV